MTDATTYRWEDDYADLHVDDSTYADFDWDDVPAAIVNRHDTVMTLDTAALGAQSFEDDDPIQRWAAARRWLALGEKARFIATVKALLASESEKPSVYLSYNDIRLELARVVATLDLHGAFALFDEYASIADHSPTEVARYRGVADVLYGDVSRGTKTLVDAVTAHAAAEPELASTIAETLFDEGHAEPAQKVLAAGIEAALAQDDPGLARELRDLAALSPSHS